MNKHPNTIVAELQRLGLSLREAEEAYETSRSQPGSAATIAKTVIEAWNNGEKVIPIYIAVQLAMAVLEPKDGSSYHKAFNDGLRGANAALDTINKKKACKP